MVKPARHSSESVPDSLAGALAGQRERSVRFEEPAHDSSILAHDGSIEATFEGLKGLAGANFIEPKRLTKVRTLGEGAFATVEQASYQHPDGTKEMVAVKRLKADLMASHIDFTDFVKEAGILSMLSHPCVVTFIGMGFRPDAEHTDVINPDSMYIVQEFMNRGTLKSKVLLQMSLYGKRIYSHVDAARWCKQIAEGLNYLHTCKPQMIIHRDLKMENVLLAEGEGGVLNAKLGDFGLHKTVEAKEEKDVKVSRLKRAATMDKQKGLGMSNEAVEQMGRKLEDTMNRAAMGLKPRRGGLTGGGSSAASAPSFTSLQSSRLGSSPHASSVPNAVGGAPAGPNAPAKSLSSKLTSSGMPSGFTIPEAEEATNAEVPDDMFAKNAPDGGGSGRKAGKLGRSGGSLPVPSSKHQDIIETKKLNRSGSMGVAGRHGNMNPTWQTVPATPKAKSKGLLDRMATMLTREKHAKYELTGQTGSFMYMAPEVMMGDKYNEKVDVFSLGVLMYELFAKSLTAAVIMETGMPDECELYALKVVAGYRRPMPNNWPPELCALISSCWDSNPDDRPSTQQVLKELDALEADGVFAALDEEEAEAVTCTCCLHH